MSSGVPGKRKADGQDERVVDIPCETLGLGGQRSLTFTNAATAKDAVLDNLGSPHLDDILGLALPALLTGLDDRTLAGDVLACILSATHTINNAKVVGDILTARTADFLPALARLWSSFDEAAEVQWQLVQALEELTSPEGDWRQTGWLQPLLQPVAKVIAQRAVSCSLASIGTEQLHTAGSTNVSLLHAAMHSHELCMSVCNEVFSNKAFKDDLRAAVQLPVQQEDVRPASFLHPILLLDPAAWARIELPMHTLQLLEHVEERFVAPLAASWHKVIKAAVVPTNKILECLRNALQSACSSLWVTLVRTLTVRQTAASSVKEAVLELVYLLVSNSQLVSSLRNESHSLNSHGQQLFEQLAGILGQQAQQPQQQVLSNSDPTGSNHVQAIQLTGSCMLALVKHISKDTTTKVLQCSRELMCALAQLPNPDKKHEAAWEVQEIAQTYVIVLFLRFTKQAELDELGKQVAEHKQRSKQNIWARAARVLARVTVWKEEVMLALHNPHDLGMPRLVDWAAEALLQLLHPKTSPLSVEQRKQEFTLGCFELLLETAELREIGRIAAPLDDPVADILTRYILNDQSSDLWRADHELVKAPIAPEVHAIAGWMVVKKYENFEPHLYGYTSGKALLMLYTLLSSIQQPHVSRSITKAITGDKAEVDVQAVVQKVTDTLQRLQKDVLSRPKVQMHWRQQLQPSRKNSQEPQTVHLLMVLNEQLNKLICPPCPHAAQLADSPDPQSARDVRLICCEQICTLPASLAAHCSVLPTGVPDPMPLDLPPLVSAAQLQSHLTMLMQLQQRGDAPLAQALASLTAQNVAPGYGAPPEIGPSTSASSMQAATNPSTAAVQFAAELGLASLAVALGHSTLADALLMHVRQQAALLHVRDVSKGLEQAVTWGSVGKVAEPIQVTTEPPALLDRVRRALVSGFVPRLMDLYDKKHFHHMHVQLAHVIIDDLLNVRLA